MTTMLAQSMSPDLERDFALDNVVYRDTPLTWDEFVREYFVKWDAGSANAMAAMCQRHRRSKCFYFLHPTNKRITYRATVTGFNPPLRDIIRAERLDIDMTGKGSAVARKKKEGLQKLPMLEALVQIRSRIVRRDRVDARNNYSDEAAMERNTQDMIAMRLQHLDQQLRAEPRASYPDHYKAVLRAALSLTIATGGLRHQSAIEQVCTSLAHLLELLVRESEIDEKVFREDVASLTRDMIVMRPPDSPAGFDAMYDNDGDA
jgi:hypothetical protein